MWPFGKSRHERGDDVVRFVVDAATLAFDEALLDGSLLRCMHEDPYVLAYVLERLRGLAQYACADAGLEVEREALTRAAENTLLGASAAVLRAQAIVFASCAGAARARYASGAANGALHNDYLFGTRDVRSHPYYNAARRREMCVAATLPGNRFNGSDAAIAHQLEHYTFACYLARSHALISRATDVTETATEPHLGKR